MPTHSQTQYKNLLEPLIYVSFFFFRWLAVIRSFIFDLLLLLFGECKTKQREKTELRRRSQQQEASKRQ